MTVPREPFFLTGPFGRPLSGIRIDDLGRIWDLPPATCAALAAIARAGVSAVVVNPWSGVGKTLLLESLLNDLPPHRRPIYLRGLAERFDWLADDAIDRYRDVLVANEISDHLGLYLWGPPARRALSLATAGWTLWGTAHATGAEDLLFDWVHGGILESVAKLPDRLVVIAIEANETSRRRALRFEIVEHGVPFPVEPDVLFARLRETVP